MCNREAASVEAAAQRWAGKVNFVGVAWAGSESSFEDFVDKHSLTFPQISDDPGAVFQRFEVPGQPAFAFVAADGATTTQLGAVDETTLDELLAAAAG